MQFKPNHFENFVKPEAGQSTSPIRVLEPMTMSPETRYGIKAVGGYRDHNGILYPWRYIGGSIDFSGIEGRVDLYRGLDINYLRSNKDGTNEWDQYVKSYVIPSLQMITESFIKILSLDATFAFDERGNPLEAFRKSAQIERIARVAVSSGHAFTRWFEIDQWGTIVSNIYARYPRQIVETTERFYCYSFADDKGEPTTIPGSFIVPFTAQIDSVAKAFDGYVDIKPPVDIETVHTRIRANKGCWISICHVLGFSQFQAIRLWEELNINFGIDATKTLKPEALFEWVAKIGEAPVSHDKFLNEGFTTAILSALSKAPAVQPYALQMSEIIYRMIIRTILLKLYAVTVQNISLKDWKCETTWNVFFPGMPDEQFTKVVEKVTDMWKPTQIKVPSAGMNAKIGLKILPITSDKSVGYKVYFPDKKPQHDSIEYSYRPAVSETQIVFGISQIRTETGEVESTRTALAQVLEKKFKDAPYIERQLGMVNFSFISIQTLNQCEHEEIVSYNKAYGEVDSVIGTDDVDSAVRFGIVYPHWAKRLRPLVMGMKFEPRHWPMLFEYVRCLNAPVIVPNCLAEMEYGMQSLSGPNYYLVGASSCHDGGLKEMLKNFQELVFPKVSMEKNPVSSIFELVAGMVLNIVIEKYEKGDLVHLNVLGQEAAYQQPSEASVPKSSKANIHYDVTEAEIAELKRDEDPVA